MNLRIALLAAVVLLVSGCGNKGPLVLPTRPAAAPAETAPAGDPATAETSDDGTAADPEAAPPPPTPPAGEGSG